LTLTTSACTACDDYGMSSQPRPLPDSQPADVRVVPIARYHLQGFHAAVDSVARERRFLAMVEAPSFVRTRRFVLDSLRDGAIHLVAVAGYDEVVGWCDLRPKAALTQRHSAVLGMGIVAGHRGFGLGTHLLRETLDRARLAGLRRAELIVRADNAAAIALYRRFQFVVEGTLREYLRIDDVAHDALLMARLD
jgi:ribosomal protein S18 acetylase RimI-like enzyme